MTKPPNEPDKTESPHIHEVVSHVDTRDHPQIEVIRDGIDLTSTLKEYTPKDEVARLSILQKLQAEGKKTNILGVKKSERKSAMERTRRRYGQMESARQATNRLFAAINEHFSPEDAEELKDLTRHAIGHYLNTDQYHSAPHALGMAREILQVADVAGYTDPKLLKALVITALYHDTGNGLAPVSPVGEKGDEVQSFKILMEDIKMSEEMADLEERGEMRRSKKHLHALSKIRKETIALTENGRTVEYPTIDVIAASIAATVFRDRFAPPDSVAFDEYAISILEILYDKNGGEIPVTALPNIKRLMNSGPAWLSKNADISGSTNTANVLQANLANRLEDYRRGLAKDAGPEGYHGGFIGFISGMFYQGTVWAPVEQARHGAPFYMPDGNREASEAYGRQRLTEEKERFNQLLKSNKPMMVALYIIMYKGIENGENILDWPLERVRGELEKIATRDGGLTNELEEMQQRGIMTKEQDRTLSLKVDEESYPLLFEKRFEKRTIAELTPGLVNRVFAPNAARAQTPAQQKLANEIGALGARPTWEQIETLSGFGKITETQKALIDEERVVKGEGKERAQYWNDLRKVGLSITQIQTLIDCEKIHMSRNEHKNQTARVMETLEDLEGGTTIDELPCLSRFLEVADLNPEILQMETFPAGEVMIHEGEKPERVLVVVKGRAVVKLSNGRDVILSPGSIMGEISALTGKGAVANVVAGKREDVVCIALPSYELVQEYQNTDLRLHAARLAAKRLGITLQQPSK